MLIPNELIILGNSLLSKRQDNIYDKPLEVQIDEYFINHGEVLLEMTTELQKLMEIILSHEVDSLCCDRDGEKYCDCLSNLVRDIRYKFFNKEKHG